MERLTERTSVGEAIPRLDVKNNGHTKCMKKLAEYEDLEEQGLLLRLPCKVGDIVYVNAILGVGEIEECKIIRVDYHSASCVEKGEFYIGAVVVDSLGSYIGFYDKEIGKTVFFTKSDAEQALAKWKER